MNNKFWYNDISVLFNRHYLLEIVPLKKYSLNRKLNACLRLAIYYSIIMYLINKNSSYFCIPFIVIIITVYIYKSQSNKNENYNKIVDQLNNDDFDELVEQLNDENYRNPTKDNPMMNYLPNTMDDEDKDKEAIPTYDNIVASKLVDNKYNEKTFIDEDDIFNRNTGMRQFYTVPNTEVVNRQGEFATWCYGNIGREKLSY